MEGLIDSIKALGFTHHQADQFRHILRRDPHKINVEFRNAGLLTSVTIMTKADKSWITVMPRSAYFNIELCMDYIKWYTDMSEPEGERFDVTYSKAYEYDGVYRRSNIRVTSARPLSLAYLDGPLKVAYRTPKAGCRPLWLLKLWYIPYVGSQRCVHILYDGGRAYYPARIPKTNKRLVILDKNSYYLTVDDRDFIQQVLRMYTRAGNK